MCIFSFLLGRTYTIQPFCKSCNTAEFPVWNDPGMVDCHVTSGIAGQVVRYDVTVLAHYCDVNGIPAGARSNMETLVVIGVDTYKSRVQLVPLVLELWIYTVDSTSHISQMVTAFWGFQTTNISVNANITAGFAIYFVMNICDGNHSLRNWPHIAHWASLCYQDIYMSWITRKQIRVFCA